MLEEDPETGRRVFQFVPGPVFANVILADEINRTPPKTQAALLQAMQEQQVTVGNETLELEPPFFVLATQNPIEQEGTYPLPEAQLDRFMLELRITYPSFDEEREIATVTTSADSPDDRAGDRRRAPAPSSSRWCAGSRPRHRSWTMPCVSLAAPAPTTRTLRPSFARWWPGAPVPAPPSTWYSAARRGRHCRDGPFPNLDDVRAIAPDVLRHRIVPGFEAEAAGPHTRTIWWRT